MAIERDIRRHHAPEDRARILGQLEHISEALRELRTPPSFGDQLYALRDHVAAVRRQIEADRAV